MKRKLLGALVGAAGIGLLACSSSSSAPDEPPVQHGLDFTAFDSAMNAGITAEGLEGATVVVVQKDWGSST